MTYIFIIFFITIHRVISIDPLVLTKNGLVRGVIAEDGEYSMFLGIPYAKVNPDNPFGHVIEVPPFEEPFNANDDTAVCPQREDITLSIIGTLDCLNVNIYVPDAAYTQNQLPVMVWIHGGGFRRWSSNRESYGPKFLVKHNVILVTFNYRLGPYGFMTLNTSEVPGNAGLRDQLAALKWIKENIAAFGGNDEDITVFGHSAGAASIEFHLLSGHSDGLFHKAIMQSGSTLCDWVMTEPDVNSSVKLANFMGFPTEDNIEAVNYLTDSNPLDVIEANIEIGYLQLFKPIVENPFEGVPTMIRDKPSNLLKDTTYYSVPIIFGYTSFERLEDIYYYRESPDNYFESTQKTVEAKIQTYFNLEEGEYEKARDLIRTFYIGNSDINEETVYEMIEFDSDFSFVYPIERSIKYHLLRNTDIYQYVFDYEGERNYMKYRLNITKETGVSHGDEIGYLFDQTYVTFPVSQKDQVIVDRMTTMWTNFAKFGTPTPETDEDIPIIWKPVSWSKLVIDEGLHMENRTNHRQMAFWDAIFELYGNRTKW